ncbi:MAG TPA: alkaline phosphatase family protein [Streptosporangiaceae bacterium]|jgi:acid phosphatase
MSFRVAVPAAGLAVLLAACGNGGAAPAPATSRSTASQSAGASTVITRAAQAASPARPAARPGPPAHTVIVLEENHGYGDVIGSPQAPYLNQLARRGALFTDSHAITHPSEPNYLALFSGSTQGVTDDSCPHRFTAPNLAAELIAAGRTFAGYAEDLPAAGAPVCSAGEYARKHVPWTNFSNVPAADSQPFGSFPAGHYSRLPTVSFVIPNLCDDMHDCPVASGDSWLRAHLSGYASWAMTHHSLLIITWDENDGSPGNQIPTIVAGQPVRSGRYAEPITHYSVLRTLEDLYRLPLTGHAATAPLITGMWK